MNEIERYKRRNYGRVALPLSSILLVMIGIVFTVILYLEEGINWHLFIPLPVFGLCSTIVYRIYSSGSDLIEISSEGISVVSGEQLKKTLSYADISNLKYTFVQNYVPPKIELIGPACSIEFDGEMENYQSALHLLVHYLVKSGRKDLLESYNQQFEEIHGDSG